jgi:serine/threonine-protein kinase
MGRVYRAHDTVLDRKIALKILSPNVDAFSDWDEAKARMLREARAVAALQHPNVVAVFDLGTIDDVPFIAMELVPGKSLRAYVRDAGFPWERKLRWMLDAAAGLAAAHAANLVHRDVKPDNILVRDDGVAKVLDFGIARSATREGGASTDRIVTEITKGEILGTISHMSPEQIAGKPFDARADQFSWGVTAFELLAGSHPWPPRPERLSVTAAILTEPTPSLRALVPELPGLVAETIEKTLSKRPELRFERMEDILLVLEPFAAFSGSQRSLSRVGPLADTARSSGSLPDILSRVGSIPDTLAPLPGDAEVGATTPLKPLPAKSRGAFAALALGAVVLAVVLGAAFHRRGDAFLTRASSPDAAPPAPTALALTDLPRPTSSNPAALSEYATGLQAWHDGNIEVAREHFAAATAADPGMGPAFLRYALISLFPSSDVSPRAFTRAAELRGTFSVYDEALFECMQPVFNHVPPDWAEAERRLSAGTDRYPEDAELFGKLAFVRAQLGDTKGMREAADAALRRDPHFAQVLLSRAGAEVDDLGAMSHAAEECVEVSSQAGECLRIKSITDSLQGRCRDYEADARRMNAMNPDSPTGYLNLAIAAFDLGKPSETVWELADQAQKRFDPDEGPFNAVVDDFYFAELLGEEKKRDAALDAMVRVGRDRSEALYHAIPAYAAMRLFTEEGDLARAAAIAASFLNRQDAWKKDPGVDSFSVAFDLVPILEKALVRAGKEPEVVFEAHLQAWIEGWKKRLPRSTARYLWIYGYAMTVDTADDARKALAALPEYSPLPAFRPTFLPDALIGRTYLLAGFADRAMSLLRQAAGVCDRMEDPILSIEAWRWLGEALEATKDEAGACSAYAYLVQHWGALSAPFVSATFAKQRMTALHCGK